MPYTPDHKAETRKRIVASARKLFNRRGLGEVSIDDIMGEAGLTRGGFYNHFASKEELYAEAITQVLQCEKTTAEGKPLDFCLPPERLAQEIIAAYLSDGHFNDRDATCSLVAFPSEVARGGKNARRAYQQVLEAMVGVFEASQGESGKSRSRAIAMATLCVGGMVLARAIEDERLSSDIRRHALDAALSAGGFGDAVAAAAAE